MLYLDASALVKRYIDEPGAEIVHDAMRAEIGRWATCRVGLIETFSAVGRYGGRAGAEKVRADWPEIGVVELTAELAEEAAELTLADELRSLDALHLAAALRLPSDGLTVATFDRRLHAAARRRGLLTLPLSLN
jgi:predicted nucleic acid-binding protein